MQLQALARWNLTRLEVLGLIKEYGTLDLQVLAKTHQVQQHLSERLQGRTSMLQHQCARGEAVGAAAAAAAGVAAVAQAAVEKAATAAGQVLTPRRAAMVQQAAAAAATAAAKAVQRAATKASAAVQSGEAGEAGGRPIAPVYPDVPSLESLPTNPFEQDEGQLFGWDPMPAAAAANNNDLVRQERQRRAAGEAAAAAVLERAAQHSPAVALQPPPALAVSALPTSWRLLCPAGQQPTAVPPDSEFVHERFLAAMQGAPLQQDDEAAEALLLLRSSSEKAAKAAASTAEAAGADGGLASSSQQHVQQPGSPGYTVHAHGTSRRASKWFKGRTGPPRVLPALRRPVATPAEKLLFTELRDAATLSAAAGPDWDLFKALWNQRFVLQLELEEELTASQMIYPKGKKELKDYNAEVDRSVRSLENRQYSKARTSEEQRKRTAAAAVGPEVGTDGVGVGAGTGAARAAAAAIAKHRQGPKPLKQGTFSASGAFMPPVRKEPRQGIAGAAEEAGSSGQGGGHAGASVGPSHAAKGAEAGDVAAEPATTSGRAGQGMLSRPGQAAAGFVGAEAGDVGAELATTSTRSEQGILSRLGKAAAGFVGLGRSPRPGAHQGEPVAKRPRVGDGADERPEQGPSGEGPSGQGSGDQGSGKRGPYLCGPCAWHLKQAVYKPHTGDCPAAVRFGALPRGLKFKGKNFNAREFLRSQDPPVEIPPPPPS